MSASGNFGSIGVAQNRRRLHHGARVTPEPRPLLALGLLWATRLASGGVMSRVLMWDDIGCVHNVVADYMLREPRYMRRVQVMATFDYPALVA
jgi:hypothetical protein